MSSTSKSQLRCYGGPNDGGYAPDLGYRYWHSTGFGTAALYEREHYWRQNPNGSLDRVYVWVLDGSEAPTTEQVFADLDSKEPK